MSAKSRSSSVSLLLSGLLLCGGPAIAQTQPTATQVATVQAIATAQLDLTRTRRQREETGVIYPYGLSGTAFNGASLIASQDAKRVAISATFGASKLSEVVLSASAPLAEDEPRSAILQLDGLANKSRVGVEWRYGQQRLPSRTAVTALTQELLKLCPLSDPKPNPDTGLDVQGCSLAELASKNPQVNEFITRYTPRQAAWYVSLKGDVGTETFKFVDPTTFADDDRQEWSSSGSLVVGALTPQNVYVAASARFEKAFEAAKSQAVCSIGTDATKIVCPSKIVGGPTPKTLIVTEFEARRYLRPIGGLNVGVAGILRRDWKEENTAIEVPLFFIKDKDGGLSGGISAGYLWSADTDARGAKLTIFVGQTFTLGGG